jgi:plastocyanin
MKKAAVAIALLLASLALVACGSSDDDSSESTAETTPPAETESGGNEESGGKSGGSESASGTLKFEADPGGQLAFTTDSATAKAGKVTVDFTNPAAVPHNVEIEDESGEDVAETETITESSESTTADLKPGTYTFYCGVPGHREAGMEGTLTVK